MSGSCHLERALNVKIGVECQIFVVIFFNCDWVLQFGAHSRYNKGALTQKRSFLVICTTFRSDFHVGWKNRNKCSIQMTWTGHKFHVQLLRKHKREKEIKTKECIVGKTSFVCLPCKKCRVDLSSLVHLSLTHDTTYHMHMHVIYVCMYVA